MLYCQECKKKLSGNQRKFCSDQCRKNLHGSHNSIILKELCKRVRANYNLVNFKKKNWYKKYSWTIKEQESYSKWLFNYLYNNKEARDEFLSISIKDRKIVESGVNWFVFMYGWNLKE